MSGLVTDKQRKHLPGSGADKALPGFTTGSEFLSGELDREGLSFLEVAFDRDDPAATYRGRKA